VYAPIGRDAAVQAIITDTLQQNFDQARDAARATVDDVAAKGPPAKSWIATSPRLSALGPNPPQSQLSLTALP